MSYTKRLFIAAFAVAIYFPCSAFGGPCQIIASLFREATGWRTENELLIKARGRLLDINDELDRLSNTTHASLVLLRAEEAFNVGENTFVPPDEFDSRFSSSYPFNGMIRLNPKYQKFENTLRDALLAAWKNDNAIYNNSRTYGRNFNDYFGPDEALHREDLDKLIHERDVLLLARKKLELRVRLARSAFMFYVEDHANQVESYYYIGAYNTVPVHIPTDRELNAQRETLIQERTALLRRITALMTGRD